MYEQIKCAVGTGFIVGDGTRSATVFVSSTLCINSFRSQEWILIRASLADYLKDGFVKCARRELQRMVIDAIGKSRCAPPLPQRPLLWWALPSLQPWKFSRSPCSSTNRCWLRSRTNAFPPRLNWCPFVFTNSSPLELIVIWEKVVSWWCGSLEIGSYFGRNAPIQSGIDTRIRNPGTNGIRSLATFLSEFNVKFSVKFVVTWWLILLNIYLLFFW